jgi:hypothetical protein
MAVAGILFSSCNSNYSITKRRYNKGYYVHHTGKQAEPGTKDKPDFAKQQTPEKIYIQAVTKSVDVTSNDQSKNHLVATGKGKQASKLSPAKLNTLNSVKHTLPAEFTMRHQVKALKQLAKRASGDAGDDALSLLWIVVVVLLILWLIGFLLDIGGPAIHLLAVIALILLILWLLRII